MTTLKVAKTKKPRTRGKQPVSTKKISPASNKKQAEVLLQKLRVGFVPKKTEEISSDR